MDIELGPKEHKDLFDQIRKILFKKNFSYFNIRQNPNDKKIIVEIFSADDLNLDRKTKRAIWNKITKFYKEKLKILIDKKSYEIQIIKREFLLTEQLIISLNKLEPHSKTPEWVLNLHKEFIEGRSVTSSSLTTILSYFIWPELDEKIEKTYKTRPYGLNPGTSPLANALAETDYLQRISSEMISNLNPIFNKVNSLTKKIDEIDIHSNLKLGLKNLNIYLNIFHALDADLENLNNQAKIITSREKILTRVCSQLSDFFKNLSREHIEPLWHPYEIYQDTTIPLLSDLKKILNSYSERYNDTNTIFDETFEKINNSIKTIQLKVHQERQENQERRKEELKKQQIIDHKRKSTEPSSFPLRFSETEESITSFYKKQAAESDKRTQRKTNLKESKPNKELTTIVLQGTPTEEIQKYYLTQKRGEGIQFSLSDDHVFCINSLLGYYALNVGLINIPQEFLQVLENKADRKLLRLRDKGHPGIKRLSQDIFIIKSKQTSDRLIIIGLMVEEEKFFLPAAIITHAKWEQYATTPDHVELKTLQNKIKETFSIKKVIENISIEKSDGKEKPHDQIEEQLQVIEQEPDQENKLAMTAEEKLLIEARIHYLDAKKAEDSKKAETLFCFAKDKYVLFAKVRPLDTDDNRRYEKIDDRLAEIRKKL